MTAREKKYSIQNRVRAFLEVHPEVFFTPREIATELGLNYFSVGDAMNMLSIKDSRVEMVRGQGTIRADGVQIRLHLNPITAPILNEAVKPGMSFERMRIKKFQKKVQSAIIEYTHGYESGHVKWNTPGRTIIIIWRRRGREVKKETVDGDNP